MTTIWRGAALPRAPSATRRLRLSEARFQGQVIALAKLRGWAVFHPYDSRRSTSGWPDLALLRPPVLWLVELKTDNGRLTAPQEQWLEALGRCDGVRVAVWRPRDWDEIARVLT
jgi:hypothetical protein